jgi:transcription antitermination factor NusG
MSDRLSRIPVTEALRRDYDLLNHLVGAAGLDWIVLQTNPNCEARAVASVQAAGVIAWCPMVSGVGRRGRQKKEHDASRPMCVRYIFAALDRHAQQTADFVHGCDGVEAVLTFNMDRRPHIVPARQMQVIVEEAWKAQTQQNYQPPQQLEIGAMFRLLTEEFRDLTGTVTAYDVAKGQVSGEVEMFGGKVPVRVSVDKVKAIS